MKNIEQRSVVFIYDDDEVFTSLLFDGLDQRRQSVSRGFFAALYSVLLLVIFKLYVKFLIKIFDVAILECGHVEVQDRVFCPVLFQTFDGKPLEQVFLASEIGMEGCAQQGFSEPTGTTEKYILVLLGQLVYQVSFIHVHASSVDDIAECLYSHRINSFCHSLCIFILCGKVTKSF